MNLKQYIDNAMKNKQAIAAVTVNNLETLKTLMETSIEQEAPIIAMVSTSGSKYFGGFEVVSNLFKTLKKNLNAEKVFLHLDHALEVEDCKNAINAGFDSVMYDGSTLPFDENVKNTSLVVEYAKNFSVLVEGEIGQVGGKEDDVVSDVKLASSEAIISFQEKTQVDLLAASIGTIHGVYKTKPEIKFNLVEELQTKIDVPLVLHGSSGLPTDTLKRLISMHEAKINVNTKNQQALIANLKKNINNDFTDIRDINKVMMSGFKKSLIESLELFKNV